MAEVGESAQQIRGQRGVGITVDGDECIVLPRADPRPHADRPFARFAVRVLKDDAEDVLVDAEAVAGPLKVIDDSVEVGEEGALRRPAEKR
ncbi:hypothetical protein ACFVH0_00975 [Streptomyces sp. NPDC127117]|uniref:hypothetical protein n=1 Tax=Streptomyces sp. NPDC127117 TaxID=3345368 RepID=UPI00364471EC